jgi:AP-3 complex subunit delta-1
LNCLANICNSELAQELLSDLYGMLNSTRPYIRKKTVLVLYKVFQQWPKALRLSFPRLKEKLEDPDHSTSAFLCTEFSGLSSPIQRVD